MIPVLYIYGKILEFTRYTGFGLTNEHSRASVIFSITTGLNVLTVLKLFGIEFQNYKLFYVVVPVVWFFLIYKFFSSQKINNKINLLSLKESSLSRVIGRNVAGIYIITSFVVFSKIMGG